MTMTADIDIDGRPVLTEDELIELDERGVMDPCHPQYAMLVLARDRRAMWAAPFIID